MRLRFHRFFVICFGIALLLAGGCGFGVNYDRILVSEVVDGDTIMLVNGQKVRYLGLDTPETRKKTLDVWVYKPQPFGEVAKEFNRKLVEGKVVRLEFDIQKKDDYGRLLAYCFVDGVLVNVKLLEEGLALLYTRTPNIKYVDLLVAAQKQARQNGKGIWQQDLIIQAKDAKNAIGALKIVEGKITNIQQRSRLMSMALSSGRKKDCVVVIFKEDFPFFVSERVSIHKDYYGKCVRVAGLVKEYKGEPEIIVRHPAQVEVIE